MKLIMYKADKKPITTPRLYLSIKIPITTDEKPPIAQPTLTIMLLALDLISVGYNLLITAP